MAGSLHGAARRGNLKELRVLIEEFCEDVNGYDFQKMTPLHHAAKRGHADAVNFLIQAGAKLEVVNSIGQTPLHVAAQAGRIDAARALLLHGANPNTTSDHDVTPIHRVSKKGFHELANVLIKAGADVHVADSFLRECAIHHAASEGHVEVIRMLLCNAKRCLDDVNSRGETALHMAAANNHLEACKTLIMMGVSPKWKFEFLNMKDKRQEETALHKSCQLRHVGVARLLLDSKAIPNVQNIVGRTPLHYAALGDDPSLVTFLLRAGADHLMIDYDGLRPMQYCTHEKVRMAFGVAAGITAQIQTHMTVTRQNFIHEKRRNVHLEEMRKVMGTDDKSVANQSEVAEARQARRLQKRIDTDQFDLYMRLRKDWAHKTILKYWKNYQTIKEEKRRAQERLKRKEEAEAIRRNRGKIGHTSVSSFF